MAVLGQIFLIVGALFIAVAGLGIVKMPTFFMRMQAASKASTVGVVCSLIGACLIHPSLETIIKCALISVFLILTVPIATHALADASTERKQNTGS